MLGRIKINKQFSDVQVLVHRDIHLHPLLQLVFESCHILYYSDVGWNAVVVSNGPVAEAFLN